MCVLVKLSYGTVLQTPTRTGCSTDAGCFCGYALQGKVQGTGEKLFFLAESMPNLTEQVASGRGRATLQAAGVLIGVLLRC